MARINITSPVGRIVMGSLYDPRTTDAEGNQLVIKKGPNVGQPRVDYFFALAIPKNPGETHFSHTEWGARIWALGNQEFPQAAQSPEFAWKIIDGDSRQPGKLFKGKPGKPPCENEGWAGCWVLKFSGGFAPKIYQQEGTSYVQIMQKDFCKPGYYVEVNFTVDGNDSMSNPGVYLNHSMVCFRAYGPEIVFGPDVAAVGFGASPLPAGASLTPLSSNIPLPQTPATSAPPPVPVTPNYNFVQVPPPAPPAAPAPAPTPVHQMTAAAQGITYDAYIAAGWTDVQLIQNGLMLA